MWLRRCLTFFSLCYSLTTAAPAGNWEFVVNGTTGIVALEAMVVSQTLVIMFDRPSNQPLQIDNHAAWAELWDLETNTGIALNATTNTFCATGGFLSNGTMLSLGGHMLENNPPVPDYDGRMSIRVFEPCDDPAGKGCGLFDDPSPTGLFLNQTRWYPSSLRISDGSIMIVGGIHEQTPFFNNDSVSSFEFFPKKDGGTPRPSPFLERSLPANLFPRAFLLPDGTVFMVANNQSIIYNLVTQEETILPDVPNGVRVTNPFDGTATLLPLSPPDYIPEVLVCGGTNASDSAPPEQLSTQDPASDQCSRIELTPEGIAKGWQVERMLEGRTMAEFILLPNGQVLITSGGSTGYAALGVVQDLIGDSNADHPVLRPSLYTPDAPPGQRISNDGLPEMEVVRMYHSSVTLTPNGNVMLAGSNPNPIIVNNTIFNSEFRVEYLNPPYMSADRPEMLNVPAQIGFHETFEMNINVPSKLTAQSVKVSLMDLGFSSHAFHSSARLVFLDAKLSDDKKTLTIFSPPNVNVFPPGPAFLFLTIDDVTSKGTKLMVGTGASPPVEFQGVPLPL